MGTVAPMTRSGLRSLLDEQQQTIAELEVQLAAERTAKSNLERRALELLAGKDEEIKGLRAVIVQQDETLQELYTEFGSVKGEIATANEDFLRQMAELNAEFTATVEEKNRQILARDNEILALRAQVQQAEQIQQPGVVAVAASEPVEEAPAVSPKQRRVYGKKQAVEKTD